MPFASPDAGRAAFTRRGEQPHPRDSGRHRSPASRPSLTSSGSSRGSTVASSLSNGSRARPIDMRTPSPEGRQSATSSSTRVDKRPKLYGPAAIIDLSLSSDDDDDGEIEFVDHRPYRKERNPAPFPADIPTGVACVEPPSRRCPAPPHHPSVVTELESDMPPQDLDDTGLNDLSISTGVTGLSISSTEPTSCGLSDICGQTAPRLVTPICETISRSHCEPATHCEIAPAGRKGIGLFATCDLKPGDEIVLERPLVTFTCPVQPGPIRQAFGDLSPAEQKLFLSFPASVLDARGEDDMLVRIAHTNAISCINTEERYELPGNEEEHVTVGPAEHDGSPVLSGIFERVCRVNHSCRANSAWCWRAKKGALALRALTNISQGSEITANYLGDICYTYEQRKARLRQRFNFECLCEACQSPPAERMTSDRRLDKLGQIRYAWQNTKADDYAQDRAAAQADFNEAEALARVEERWEDLLDVARERYMFHIQWMETEEAKRAGETVIALALRVWEEEDLAEWSAMKHRDDPSKDEGWGQVYELLSPDVGLRRGKV